MVYPLNNPGIPDGRSNASIDMQHGLVELGLPKVDASNEAEALVYEHPDYRLNIDRWRKFCRLYFSREVYEYIYAHTRESEPVYQNRVRRGYYLNYVASVIDLFVAYLYHSPITRQPDVATAELFEELYKDADRRGTAYSVFIQHATTFAQITGHCGVLVDMPRLDAPFASEAEREAAKHRPYLTLVQAQQIKDWELGEDNKFNWVKLEIDRPQNRDWRSSVDEETRHFVIWTRSGWEEWKVKQKAGGKPSEPELVARGDHPLGEVPLIIFRNDPDLEHAWFGISAVRDISDVNIAILNWCSLMDEEIYERCLNVLAVQRVSDDAPAIKLSHDNVLEYDGDTPPAYLVPGSTPLEMIMSAIDRLKDEIYRLAKLGGDTGLQKSRQATSGIAYAFEFNTTNQALGKKAEAAQQAEMDIHRLFAKWLGKEFTGVVTYPKEFGVEDFLTELTVLSEARTTLTSPTAIQEIEKKVTAKMFARDSQALRDEIASEIDSQDPKDPTLLNTSLGFGPPPPAEEVEDDNSDGAGLTSSSSTSE